MSSLSFERFRLLASTRLRRDVPQPGDLIQRPRSDFDHQTTPVAMPDETSLKPAAVLVPIIDRPGGATVLLTTRAASLRTHSGQIAFPGGRTDADDASPVDTALREAEEEIGLRRAHVTPLGYLDAYQTGTGFRIQPLVALVQPPLNLALDPREVEAAFEVPLAFLMDPANHQRHSRHWNGAERFFYAISHGERYIWGVTAGILRNLHERLYS